MNVCCTYIGFEEVYIYIALCFQGYTDTLICGSAIALYTTKRS